MVLEQLAEHGADCVKHTQVRDGATTVGEAVPMTVMHKARQRLHCCMFSARLGVTERHHGKKLLPEIAGNTWTKLQPEE